ncbi:aminotransferase DegT [Candidatus Roizmanbacteria bacterium RIFCSPLOWO2_01_FULL_37_13]|uniref:Aminotransferase DegT n=1 Tax=Candidatus Roizmanbacteria bacterium RIFCSPHIGHO2_02_FULL_38_11 TaxID=1802039 RepID=A0A1F7H290_9BACT|nr:MAG: aminotransferase DegT [Candidatus Roizmanbacteria bacterium RIFCSPHIGHO2_02_FULL_38_11]OGK34997.1 MAG: aminotransferase DegT [Candidatus Roizmanbacteria bacterium RIFCSPHIGHO2_12_FULL_37_9b]OGK43055.1 MAG: aminotransferase DegT [Candidatus Roizmanbacteria bacterium RIFCSPLOWO2_01_FULL_37_13]
MIPIAKPYITREDARAVYQTILTGWVTQGPKVKEFENNFAAYIGTKYAVAVSSCTAALHLAMIVCGIKAGDEVVCPSLSFIATANAIRYVGARPVFADVDRSTYNLDPSCVEKVITDKTKAILIVHQFGMPADIDGFKKLCEKYHLKLIEDAACAIGSIYKGKKVGIHSDLVCFSFHPRKVITTGDGGIITTSNSKYYQRLKLLRQHGMSIDDRTRHEAKKIIIEKYLELGYNFRMTDIQASLGITQLKKVDFILKKRREIAEKYNQAFKKIPYLVVPSEKNGNKTNYQSYTIQLKKNSPISRKKLMGELLKRDIATRRGVMLIHKEPAYRNLYPHLRVPNSEYISKNSVTLPLYVQMTRREIKRVIKALAEVFNLDA